MGKTLKTLMPLWISYVILAVLSVMGPLMQGSSELARGHWTFLFLMPYAIGAAPYGLIMGEIAQHRTRSVGRASWRLGLMHTLVVYAIFILGLLDMIASAADALYLLLWAAPSVLSGLCFVLGMYVMRHEQTRSDARYGVEVRKGDPWAGFFDLEWEDDTPGATPHVRRSAPSAVREAEARRTRGSRR
ncbi:MAG: hypothetical protein ACOX4F_07585 [Atopobiaceae bacterium]|jgi:hypothetical protein